MNGVVLSLLPPSQLGWERFLQGPPLLAASMGNEGRGLWAQTILLQMQPHWYAGMETQQPAPRTDQILEYSHNISTLELPPIFLDCLPQSGAAGREKGVRGRELTFIRHLLCAGLWSH